MARLSRAVFPGVPHHVTQRGNRRQPTFFQSSDYELYLHILREECDLAGVDVWAYCLMPNHAHALVVPKDESSLRRAFGEAHRRYTRAINEREGWLGHLWQGRFFSNPMDPAHTLAAARYIELNPVAAGLTLRPQDWEWSSARAHLQGRDDGLVKVEPLLARVEHWAEFLRVIDSPAALEAFREHQRTGRPLGSDEFVAELELKAGRPLRPRRPGPPKRVTSCVAPAPSDTQGAFTGG